MNQQETADLVTFPEKILNGKLIFLCSASFWLLYQMPCDPGPGVRRSSMAISVNA